MDFKKLTGVSCRVDRTAMLRLYRCVIHSRPDYESFIYISAYKVLPIIQSVRKVWNQWEFYLLFTLNALYVHPDTLRIFSAALPCLC
jgi:hypothetical protein